MESKEGNTAPKSYTVVNISDNVSGEEENNDSDDGADSDGLEIDFQDSPIQNVKSKLNYEDKLVLGNIEEELERQLDEKAAKTNLTATNVKNILRSVITNEDVLAMVRQTVEKVKCSNSPYEPKLTRAKVRELIKSNDATSTWVQNSNSNLISETHILINEDLPEDSSDDEYRPNEDDIPSEEESSNASDLDSQPATPRSQERSIDCSTQTNWSEDGVFRIPQTPEAPQLPPAFRTRSKLCLSDTPLEEIEGAFVPPDIPKDLYETTATEIDDEDWHRFLCEFTKPLPAIMAEPAPDEEDDPEYNVLADLEIDTVDKEELRMDKAVKVTRKELNDLMAELFDCEQLFSPIPLLPLQPPQPLQPRSSPSLQPLEKIQPETPLVPKKPQQCDEARSNRNPELSGLGKPCKIITQDKDDVSVMLVELVETFTPDQRELLNQQMRQHVQLLTQQFLMASVHPNLQTFSLQFKQLLLTLKFLSENQPQSAFCPCNLKLALELVEKWECEKVCDNPPSNSKPMNKQLPSRVLDAIKDSPVFIYPYLLPEKPFSDVVVDSHPSYNKHEDMLIAMGLEQFLPYVSSKKEHFYHKRPKRSHVAWFISKYMMPVKPYMNIFKRMKMKNYLAAGANPIKYFFQNNKAPPTTHLVIPIENYGFLAPKDRPKDTLSMFWAEYIHSELKIGNRFEMRMECMEMEVKRVSTTMFKVSKMRNIEPAENSKKPTRFKRVKKPPSFDPKKCPINPLNKKPGTSETRDSETLENDATAESIPSSQIESSAIRLNRSNFSGSEFSLESCDPELVSFKFNSSNIQCASNIDIMLPCMPSLATPMKNNEETEPTQKENDETRPEADESSRSPNCNSSSQNGNISDEERSNAEVDTESDDPKLRKNTGGNRVDVKKFKLKKDLSSHIKMLQPESQEALNKRAKSFASAYFDKVQERLVNNSPDDYRRFMETLAEFDESRSTAVELLDRVSKIFTETGNEDLGEEFVSFLTTDQAVKAKRGTQGIVYSAMRVFLRKVEVFYANNPSHLKKIYDILGELASDPDLAVDKVRNSVLPLLKNSQHLTDLFLQILPTERPPPSIFDKWEVIESEELEVDDGFETVKMPDIEDPYGGPNCVCMCHKVDDDMFRAKTRHCIPCGTKFIHGRVYVQTGRGLRPAHVVFEDNLDHSKRLSPQQLPIASSTPSTTSTFRQKRKSETLSSPQKVGDEAALSVSSASTSPLSESPDGKKSPTKQPQLQSQPQRSPSKKTKFDEEIGWTLEEDRIILETIKQEDDEEAAFVKIEQLLPGRTAGDVKKRFQCLLSLLQEIG